MNRPDRPSLDHRIAMAESSDVDDTQIIAASRYQRDLEGPYQNGSVFHRKGEPFVVLKSNSAFAGDQLHVVGEDALRELRDALIDICKREGIE